MEIVLLAVVGMSPAIVTETIWALRERGLIPNRIVAMTTSLGKCKIEEELFSAEKGAMSLWQEFRLDMGVAENELLFEDIQVFSIFDHDYGRSVFLEDISEEGHHYAVGDFLIEQIRCHAERPETRIIASIAGGRKTMGALMYGAMSLMARESDMITHILVSPPYELMRGFYYPSQRKQILVNAQGETFCACDAKLSLGDIPFVALRNIFKREEKGVCRFSDLVRSAQSYVDDNVLHELELVFHEHDPLVKINGRVISFSPSEYFVLTFLMVRVNKGRPVFSLYKDALESLKSFAVQIKGKEGAVFSWRAKATIPESEIELARKVKSIKDKIIRAFPDYNGIDRILPRKGRFSLQVCKSQIRVENFKVL